MTLILARASSEGLLIASDRCMLDGNNGISYLPKKWAKLGFWNIGISGSANHIQAIEFDKSPAPSSIEELIERFTKIFRQQGIYPTRGTESHHDNWGSQIIIARNKQIWVLDAWLYAETISEGKWAIAGSGRDIARGAIEAIEEIGSLDTQSTARLALRITADLDASVKGEYFDMIPYMQERPESRSVGRGPVLVPES